VERDDDAKKNCPALAEEAASAMQGPGATGMRHDGVVQSSRPRGPVAQTEPSQHI
jgi:hypothetical protein